MVPQHIQNNSSKGVVMLPDVYSCLRSVDAIAPEITADLEAALEQFATIAEDLK